MPAAAAPGAFFAFAAFILLLLCSLSTPIIKSIYFLRADVVSSIAAANVSGQARFGTFGWCLGDVGFVNSIFSTSFNGQCSARSLGYTFNPQVLGVTVSTGEDYDRIFNALTKVLVLVPVSCGLAFMVFLTSLFALMCKSRFWEVFSFLWSLLALVVVWVSWIIEIVAFAIARNRLRDYTDGELRGSFGNALWMHLASAIVLLITTFLTCCGMCGSYRSRRRNQEAAYTAPAPTAANYEKQGWHNRFFQRRHADATTYRASYRCTRARYTASLTSRTA